MDVSKNNCWTKKTPTKPGIYWMTFPIADVQLNVIPAQVYDGPKSILVAFPGEEKLSAIDRYDDCLWYGPISKPKAPEITIEQFMSLNTEDTIAISF